jgi:hypothetical protein
MIGIRARKTAERATSLDLTVVAFMESARV